VLYLEQDVLRYLTTKKQLMQKLKAESFTKFNALLFASQCCGLAHTIWSKNRSVVKQDELIDLLVQHAELCIDQVNSTFVRVSFTVNHVSGLHFLFLIQVQ